MSNKLETPLCTKAAARYVGLNPRTLDQWRYQGKGPAYLRIGRSIRYIQSELLAWLEAGRVSPEGLCAFPGRSAD